MAPAEEVLALPPHELVLRMGSVARAQGLRPSEENLGAWRRAWQTWLTFCELQALPPLPATEAHLRAFAVDCRISGMGEGMFKRCLEALRLAHAVALLPDPPDGIELGSRSAAATPPTEGKPAVPESPAAGHSSVRGRDAMRPLAPKAGDHGFSDPSDEPADRKAANAATTTNGLSPAGTQSMPIGPPAPDRRTTSGPAQRSGAAAKSQGKAKSPSRPKPGVAAKAAPKQKGRSAEKEAPRKLPELKHARCWRFVVRPTWRRRQVFSFRIRRYSVVEISMLATDPVNFLVLDRWQYLEYRYESRYGYFHTAGRRVDVDESFLLTAGDWYFVIEATRKPSRGRVDVWMRQAQWPDDY